MQRAALLVSIVLFGILALVFYGGTGFRSSPPPETSDPTAGASQWEQSWWPLAPKAMWRYRVLGSGPFKTRGYYVQAVSPDGTALVLENTDGKQSDNFRVRTGPGDQVEFREYQASKGSMKYLPEALEEGTRWRLREDLRAVATGYETLRIPPLEGPQEALRIEYESYFNPDQTQRPGWYPAGTRWMVKGVGLVQEDLESVEAPPELKDLVSQQRRVMQLSEFTAPWKKTRKDSP